LAGSGGVVYRITLKNAGEATQGRVLAQPWVTAVSEQTKGNGKPASGRSADGSVNWLVSVNDPAAAESQLLRLVLADPEVRVAEFGRQTYELEDVFLSIVEGDEHGK
jgi:hypothetical protein